jgi:hypothetical protein
MSRANFTNTFDDKTLIYVPGIESSKEYDNGRPVKKESPSIKLVVSPFIPPLLPVEILGADLGGLIIEYSTEKSRSTAGGTFNVTMAADDQAIERLFKRIGGGEIFSGLWKATGSSLRDLFKPMAYAQLWINGYHKMSGYLRRFTRKKSAGGRIVYVAEFDELGNLYNQQILGLDTITFDTSEQNVVNTKLKALYPLLSTPGVPLSVAVNLLINAFIVSTLAYGVTGLPTTFFRGSDGIPLAARLLSLP